MGSYLIRRFIYMILLLVAVSVVAFFVIELPPGDYLSAHLQEIQNRGGTFDQAQIILLRKQFGLDLPVYVRYFTWIGGILHGDFGRSLNQNRPVSTLLVQRLPATIMISLLTLILTYLIAIPIGIYSATHQYSIADYLFTGGGFLGLAVPNFLLALGLLYIFFRFFGLSVTGLFSPEYKIAAWSLAKFADMMKHLPIPIFVIGTSGTAGLIRVMRGCLLDEIKKQYVITARSKGLAERTLLFKYPVRVAINPIISTIGWTLPIIFSGAAITAIVLDLPTTGHLLYKALLNQDTYLAGGAVLIISFLTIVGTFISDMLLLWLDPRIRYQRSN